LAISKQRKVELMQQYEQWVKRSEALIITEYTGLAMKDMDALRTKVREVGGEFHIVKNTLGRRVLADAGMDFPASLMEGSTAIVFAYQDPPAVAKSVTEFMRTVDLLKVKGGFLGKQAVSAEGIKSLADMPPLPVMRSQLLGVFMAPASKLVRTLAEPARGLAAVIQAKYEPETA
jgi:large subunit ribosomal protein L10